MAQPYAVPTEFVRDDLPAQRAFTEAIATWLDDDSKPHHCRLELALQGFDALMAGYRSALLGKRLTERLELSDAEWEQLKARLTNKE